MHGSIRPGRFLVGEGRHNMGSIWTRQGGGVPGDFVPPVRPRSNFPSGRLAPGQHKTAILLGYFGEPGGIRTHDPMIKSHVLYRLSYGLAHNNGLRTLRICRTISALSRQPASLPQVGSNSMMGDDGKGGLRCVSGRAIGSSGVACSNRKSR
jgi:hypothetical protein